VFVLILTLIYLNFFLVTQKHKAGLELNLNDKDE